MVGAGAFEKVEVFGGAIEEPPAADARGLAPSAPRGAGVSEGVEERREDGVARTGFAAGVVKLDVEAKGEADAGRDGRGGEAKADALWPFA